MIGRLLRIAEERVPARPLAVARVGVALTVLLEILTTGRGLLRLAEPGMLSAPYVPWMPPITEPLAIAVALGWLVGGIAFLVGWHTRVAGVVLTASLLAVLLLDQQLYSNHLYLMVLTVGLLTLADAGAALSLDARRGGERELVPGWAAWLLRVQVSIVYAYSALAKLNLPFLSGSVVASSLRRDGPLAVPDGWRFLEPMLVLSLLAIMLEAFVAIAIWSRRWRPAAFVAGLGLHVGIAGWLSPTFQLIVFSLLMLPLYVLFIPAGQERWVVVWDDSCSFCGRWVGWFRRLDWLRVLKFVPRSQLPSADLPVSEEQAALSLQVVTSRRTYAGFAAVTEVAAVLPLTFLWAPLLRVPPVAAVGERVYRRVADRRSCPLPSASGYGSAVPPRT